MWVWVEYAWVGNGAEVSTRMLSVEFSSGWELKVHSIVESGRDTTLHRRDTFFPSPIIKEEITTLELYMQNNTRERVSKYT